MDEKRNERDEIVEKRFQADYDRKWRHRRLRVGRKNRRIRRERWSRSLRMAGPLLIIFIGLCVYFGYQASPASRVGSIQIAPPTARQLFRNEIPLEVGDNLHLVKRELPQLQRQLLQKHPNVTNLTATTAGNQIQIHAQIAAPVAALQIGQRFKAVYPNGRTQPKQFSHKRLEQLTQLQGNLDAKTTTVLGKQLGRVSKGMRTNVAEITPEKGKGSHEQVLLKLRDGNQIIMFANQLEQKLRDYQKLKPTLRKPSIVHMEFGAYATPIQ
ncbi:hypothetical protein M3M39_03810 [Fructilactobacillus hinvesii]|uniref:Cell division protein DivIB n=1 Tax=Fructilactobacillus hinvesii TaxID=2940300 RepID=A0ABY5BQK2_9LACO|nr:hypothetical protein [Fructilactobacillus hinvesii]USS87255.1 hypothetical protein M3M39_03810 [Fructilactobacillus hinvesii]